MKTIVKCLAVLLIITSCSPTPKVLATQTTGAWTPIPEPTTKPIPKATLKVFQLNIFVFHDFNGNEVFEEEIGEVAIENASINIEDSCLGEIELITNEKGKFSTNVCQGTTSIKVHKNENLDYLYFNKSVLNANEKITVKMNSNINLQLALGNGPFTIPIMKESFKGITYDFGADHYDNANIHMYHAGLDIEIQGNGPQPIYAPVAGMINGSDESFGECNHVTIEFEDPTLNKRLNFGMGHLTEVAVKLFDKVEKGDLIGFINPDLYYPGFVACTSQPHIHMNIWGNIPGITWSREGEEGGRWEILPAGEWGWIDSELFLPLLKSPMPMFTSEAQYFNFMEK